jgi:hypothetical protein
MESIVIYIPEIRIELEVKLYKICIIFDRPKIILIRNKNELLPIKIIDGIEENKILYNLMIILKFIKEFKYKTNVKNK